MSNFFARQRNLMDFDWECSTAKKENIDVIENRNGDCIFDCWLNEYAPYGVQKLRNSCNPTQLNFFIIAHYLYTRICFRTRDLMHGSVRLAKSQKKLKYYQPEVFARIKAQIHGATLHATFFYMTWLHRCNVTRNHWWLATSSLAIIFTSRNPNEKS